MSEVPPRRPAPRSTGRFAGPGPTSPLRPGLRQDRRRDVGLALVAGSFGLLQLGLLRGFGTASLWSLVPTWSVFASVAVLVVGVPYLLRTRAGGSSGRGRWRIAAIGTTAFAAFWVLVVLPGVASNRGFVLTMALALLAGAVWCVPGRDR